MWIISFFREGRALLPMLQDNRPPRKRGYAGSLMTVSSEAIAGSNTRVPRCSGSHSLSQCFKQGKGHAGDSSEKWEDASEGGRICHFPNRYPYREDTQLVKVLLKICAFPTHCLFFHLVPGIYILLFNTQKILHKEIKLGHMGGGSFKSPPFPQLIMFPLDMTPRKEWCLF